MEQILLEMQLVIAPITTALAQISARMDAQHHRLDRAIGDVGRLQGTINTINIARASGQVGDHDSTRERPPALDPDRTFNYRQDSPPPFPFRPHSPSIDRVSDGNRTGREHSYAGEHPIPSHHRSIKIIAPERFKGNGDNINDALYAWTSYFRVHQVPMDDFCDHAPSMFTGRALQAYTSYAMSKDEQGQTPQWEEVVSLMRDLFQPIEADIQARQALLTTHQTTDVASFVLHFKMLVTRAGLPRPHDLDLIGMFLRGLKPDISRQCMVNPTTGSHWSSIDALTHFACRMDKKPVLSQGRQDRPPYHPGAQTRSQDYQPSRPQHPPRSDPHPRRPETYPQRSPLIPQRSDSRPAPVNRLPTPPPRPKLFHAAARSQGERPRERSRDRSQGIGNKRPAPGQGDRPSTSGAMGGIPEGLPFIKCQYCDYPTHPGLPCHPSRRP